MKVSIKAAAMAGPVRSCRIAALASIMAEEHTFEEDLLQEVLEIITVFSARLNGSRSHQNQQVMQQLKEVADEVSRQNPA